PQASLLQASTDLALAGLEFAQSEVRVDRIDEEPEAVLRVEGRPGTYEQFDARSDRHAGRRLERRQDLVGDVRPDHGARPGEHDAAAGAFGHLEVDVVLDRRLDDVDDSPFPLA